MAKDIITLVLDGEVSLGDFSTAVSSLLDMVSGLEKECARDIRIKWVIDALEASSATATVRGVTEGEQDGEAVWRVVDSYLDVGRSLEQDRPIRHSSVVQAAGNRIVKLIGDRIRSVRFETEEDDAQVFRHPKEVLLEARMQKARHGCVRGRVQSMSSRGGLRFTLYDIIDDHPISCYLAPRSEDIMRESWGKLANVEGLVRRNPETTQPTTVRHITNITILCEPEPGAWRQAIGAARGFLGDTKPEDIIREGRDV
jgi:hypothetical protein